MNDNPKQIEDDHLGPSILKLFPVYPGIPGTDPSARNSNQILYSQLMQQIAVPDDKWKITILEVIDRIWGQYNPSGTQPITASEVYACRALTLRLALSSELSVLEIREFVREQFNSRILETLAMYAIIVETLYNETSIPSEVSRMNIEIYVMDNLMLRQHLAILKPD